MLPASSSKIVPSMQIVYTVDGCRSSSKLVEEFDGELGSADRLAIEARVVDHPPERILFIGSDLDLSLLIAPAGFGLCQLLG
jgi:hypothetical protein